MDEASLEQQVSDLTDQLPPLTVQIRESNERAAQARRLTFWHAAIGVLMCVVLFGVIESNNRQTATEKQAKQTALQVSDCVLPGGKCKQRNDQVLAITTEALAYRGELERLKTELPISESKGDDVRVTESKKRLAELQTDIDDANARIHVIEQQIDVKGTK